MTWFVYDETRPTKCIGQFEDADDACLFARLKAACKGYKNGCDLNLLFAKSGRFVPKGFSIVDFDQRARRALTHTSPSGRLAPEK